jgi:hypothetical protein
MRLFKRQLPDKPKTTWVASEHKNWGDNIQWMKWEDRSIVGWTDPHPQPGDQIIFDMKSGRRAIFQIRSVDPCGDPPDMWFAKLNDIGYVETEPK